MKSKALDYVMKFENLKEDFKVIQENLNCFEPLNTINKSNKEHDYRKYYTDESYDIITKNCATDIEKFNYTF